MDLKVSLNLDNFGILGAIDANKFDNIDSSMETFFEM